MQKRALHAQKRCCFKALPPLSQVWLFLFDYYSNGTKAHRAGSDRKYAGSDRNAPVLAWRVSEATHKGCAELARAAVADLLRHLEHGHRALAQKPCRLRQALLLQPGVQRMTVETAEFLFECCWRDAEAGAESVDCETFIEMAAHIAGHLLHDLRERTVAYCLALLPAFRR